MNFYTLTYDANVPTTQQLNIPTNTDYKIGVKVRRNGEVLDLNPEDMTLGTLSADARKTNGYVTFTKASGDEASMEMFNLSVDYTPLSAQNILINKTQSIQAAINLSASAPELIGKEITPSDYYASLVRSDGTTAPTSADVEAAYQTYWDYYKNSQTAQLIVYTYPYTYRLYATCQAIDTAARNGQLSVIDLPPKGVDYFLVVDNVDGTDYWRAILSYTLKEDDIVTTPRIVQSRPYVYRGMGVKLQLGQSLRTDFKLVENVFKSQQGDLGDIDFDNTVNIAGTLSDDTEFSYDTLVK